jgi:4a-hydroxytetrahydrobiopterin dehydratase
MSETKDHVYSEADIPVKLTEYGLTSWTYEDKWIRRKFTTENWLTTLCLINAIGFISEAAYHHPDLVVSWGKLWVKLQTHSAGGITDKDFALARRIEDIALWKPQPGSPFDELPGKWVKG